MVTTSGGSSDGVVLGLDFGGTKTAVAVADLDGRQLAARVLDSRLSGESAEECFARGRQAGQDLVSEVVAGRIDDRLAAVGACTFGIPFDDRVELAPTIPGWGSLAFGRELRAAFPGVEVRVATDVKAAAAAEVRWGALMGCDPALYLNLGTGIAAAIVCGGVVLEGRHGAAGEIAYNLRRPTDIGAVPGGRAPLEEQVSGQGLSRRATTGAGRPVRAAEVFRLADDDASMAALLDDFVAELCFHVVNLAVAVDPQRIAVGGGMVRSWDRLGGRLREALDAAVPFPPELVVAAFPHDAALRGVLAMAAEAAEHVRSAEVA